VERELKGPRAGERLRARGAESGPASQQGGLPVPGSASADELGAPLGEAYLPKNRHSRRHAARGLR